MAGVSAVSATSHTRGIGFLLGADLAYTVYSGTNSSPQTTDVFGDDARIGTLMKYVKIGGIKTLFYVSVASWLDRSVWPLIGGIIAGSSMHYLYIHAAGEARKRGGAGSTMEAPAGQNGRPSGFYDRPRSTLRG